MKNFAKLIYQIDSTTSLNEKTRHMREYFRIEDPANAVWALYLLMGKSRKRTVTSRMLSRAYLNSSQMPDWLYQECYSHVGDTAETISLLLKGHKRDMNVPMALHEWLEVEIPKIKELTSDREKEALITSWWQGLEENQIFVLNKVLTGAFRIGVSSKLVIRAAAGAFDLSEAVVAHQLMGDFPTTAEFYEALKSGDVAESAPSQPYPFLLSYSLEEERFADEDLNNWQFEWKWDGIRAQLIKRAGEVFIWSRGEDLITHQFPEIAEEALKIPDGHVLDGEIVAWRDGANLGFNALQKRLGRVKVSNKLIEESPTHFIAFDLIEASGDDFRERPLADRRAMLSALISNHHFDKLSLIHLVDVKSFSELQQLRANARDEGVGIEGLMIKRRDSTYQVGRRKGVWWKYKVDPYTLDAVLIYAQAGSGRRANLFTDYTFALWNGNELVPFAKAYSGLDNDEIAELDRWIRQNTVEKFGPVRSVRAELVFEIAFEGIAESNRHKSGVAVRFPRIHRWRKDKEPKDADQLETAKGLIG